jgi:hypothetical protein
MAKRLDVEELVNWAFEKQRVEDVAKTLMPQAPASLVSGLSSLLVLGTRVDSSSAGARMLGARCHEDAAVIYDAVMALAPEAWMLVIKHGRNGTRPDWHEEGPGEWVQPVDKQGNPRKLWRDPANRRGFLGFQGPVLIGTDPVHVELARTSWSLWRAGLADLIPVLNAEMVDHVAEGPAIPTEPWLVMANAEGLLTRRESLT